MTVPAGQPPPGYGWECWCKYDAVVHAEPNWRLQAANVARLDLWSAVFRMPARLTALAHADRALTIFSLRNFCLVCLSRLSLIWRSIFTFFSAFRCFSASLTAVLCSLSFNHLRRQMPVLCDHSMILVSTLFLSLGSTALHFLDETGVLLSTHFIILHLESAFCCLARFFVKRAQIALRVLSTAQRQLNLALFLRYSIIIIHLRVSVILPMRTRSSLMALWTWR